MTPPILLFAILVLGFAVGARGLGRMYLTAPIAFVVAGVVLSVLATASPTATSISPDTVTTVRAVTETTLALVLFHDAAQVRPRQLGADAGTIARLLLVGLPLTILLGFGAARVLFPETPAAAALLLAAALAPTDASLGAATVLDDRIPVRIRRLLNAESGLNDGLATPVVLFAIAVLAGQEGLRPATTLAHAALELGVGALVGAVVGAGGGRLIGWSRTRDLSTRRTRALAVLTLPVIAFFGAEQLGGTAFVASFVAGTAFAGVATWADHDELALGLTELLSEPLTFAVWLVFGIAVLPLLRDEVGWREIVLAVLALTVLRMVPVALALAPDRFRAPTVAMIGWFGPRGMASVVFVLLALESIEVGDAGRPMLAAVALTVLLSVVAHGMTADPLAGRYASWVERTRPAAELATALEPRVRLSLLPHRHG